MYVGVRFPAWLFTEGETSSASSRPLKTRMCLHTAKQHQQRVAGDTTVVELFSREASDTEEVTVVQRQHLILHSPKIKDVIVEFLTDVTSTLEMLLDCKFLSIHMHLGLNLLPAWDLQPSLVWFHLPPC